MKLSPDVADNHDPQAHLERALIDEFLRTQGTDWERLRELPNERATRLMRAASAYASARLSELESRARLVHAIHGQAGE